MREPLVATNEQILARSITSALTTTEYTLWGSRTHIFVLKSGIAELLIGEKSLEVGPSSLVWLPPGKQRAMRLGSGATGWMASIPDLHLGPFIPPGTIGSNIREVVAQLAVMRDISAKKTRCLRRSNKRNRN